MTETPAPWRCSAGRGEQTRRVTRYVLEGQTPVVDAVEGHNVLDEDDEAELQAVIKQYVTHLTLNMP